MCEPLCQRLTKKQRQQVQAWFPELRYWENVEWLGSGFYDPETEAFHEDACFLAEGMVIEREIIHLCILMKHRQMVKVWYTCALCGNEWVDSYIRIPQDTRVPYMPQARCCTQCQAPVTVTCVRDYCEGRVFR